MDWISVKDRLPNEYEDVLVFTDKHFIHQSHWYTYHGVLGNKLWSIGDDCRWGYITHWASLPEPPKD